MRKNKEVKKGNQQIVQSNKEMGQLTDNQIEQELVPSLKIDNSTVVEQVILSVLWEPIHHFYLIRPYTF